MLTQTTRHTPPGFSEGVASRVPILQNRKLSHSSCVAGKWLKATAGPYFYLPPVTQVTLGAASC